ncbi:MAG: hypothetical protein PWQ97_467 [Tepidanaerobacteraceae bacterium]|nr:hypothetical protein [Tepidanaerobacteraceae bacterium]
MIKGKVENLMGRIFVGETDIEILLMKYEGKEIAIDIYEEDPEKYYVRYSDPQKNTIKEYWSMMRQSRKSGRIAPSIIEKEMKYWDKFPNEIVIEALDIHLKKYGPSKREDYTRGIIRSLAREKASGKVKKHNDGKYADITL